MIPEYQQRVMGEYTDLTSKMAKLTAFLAHMNSYAQVLHARLVNFGFFSK